MVEKKEGVKRYGKREIGYFSEIEGKISDLGEKILDMKKTIEAIRNYYGGTLHSDLTSKVSGFFGIGFLIVAFYFLAPNFTGNVIANLEVGKTNLFGSGLFLLGLVGIFVCLKKCRK